MFTLVGFFFFSFNLSATPLTVGSKKFTESVILGEIISLLSIQSGLKVEHKKELGGTRILWNALLSGDLDLYPEYSGTIEQELLKKKISNFKELRLELAKIGLGVSDSIGFNNTYAIGMTHKKARQLEISKISDLSNYKNLKIAWSSEFRNRQDGWPGLKKKYNLPHKFIRGMDHDIAYRALVQGATDVIDLYSTDAEISYYNLKILKDDLSFFPRYEAVYLYRLEHHELLDPILKKVVGVISNEDMSSLNQAVKIDKNNSTKVAATYLKQKMSLDFIYKKVSMLERVMLRSREHFKLVFVSLFFAILAAVPLGIIVAKSSRLGQFILMLVSTIQTIPALALLVLMIKPLSSLGLSGIGNTPAYVALFLYSLLPIVRNTSSGINQIPIGLKESAEVFNLSPLTRLLKIEIPLSMPNILTGVKTSLVLNIGFATLGALVGAGGLGQPILTGIRLDDYKMILEGALPAAIFALSAQWGFAFLDRFLISPGILMNHRK